MPSVIPVGLVNAVVQGGLQALSDRLLLRSNGFALLFLFGFLNFQLSAYPHKESTQAACNHPHKQIWKNVSQPVDDDHRLCKDDAGSGNPGTDAAVCSQQKLAVANLADHMGGILYPGRNLLTGGIGVADNTHLVAYLNFPRGLSGRANTCPA